MPPLSHLAVRALRRTHLLGYANFRTRMPIGDRTFVIPIRGSAGYDNIRQSEPWLLQALVAMHDWRPGAFLDVGVNVGQTLLKYAAAGGRGPYYGFDPNTAAVAYVKELARLNALDWAQVIPVALSDHTGCVRLHLSSPVDAAASIVDGFRPDSFYERTEPAVAFRGDEIVAALQPGPVSMVKVDVEGGELEVLTGLEGTIAAHRPVIFCEVLPVYETDSNSGKRRRERTDALVALLDRHDYRIVRLLRDGPPTALTGIETHGDRTLCEYMFHPAETAAIVASRMSAHALSH